MLLPRVVFGQRFDDEIEPEPQAPTVMIKSHRKHEGHHEEQSEHILVFCADNQQKEEANDQDHKLCRDHICENSPNEKPVLTFEKGEAVWAVVPNVKRVSDDLGFTTRRTAQSQATPQHLFDLSKVFFQGITILTPGERNGKAFWAFLCLRFVPFCDLRGKLVV